jgi:hypothetical protein
MCLPAGGPYSGKLVVVGLLAGAAFIMLSQQYLEQYEVDGFEELRGAEARKVSPGSGAGRGAHAPAVA